MAMDMEESMEKMGMTRLMLLKPVLHMSYTVEMVMILSMALRHTLKEYMEVLVMTPYYLVRRRYSLIDGPISMEVTGTTRSQVARL